MINFHKDWQQYQDRDLLVRIKNINELIKVVNVVVILLVVALGLQVLNFVSQARS